MKRRNPKPSGTQDSACYIFSVPSPIRAHPVKLTYDDYLGFPEDGRRHEILDGEHAVTPSPNRRHQSIHRVLFRRLDAWAIDQGGDVFSAPFDVLLAEATVVQPDLLFISPERSEILTADNVRGAPDLVVEIVSESTRHRDEITKRHLYEKHGVAEYWIVDPALETVKVYSSAEAGFGEPVLLSREQRHELESSRLPAFSIDLEEIFS